MAIERKSPDALQVSTNLTGSVAVITDDPNLSFGDWLAATDETLDTVARVSFPSPTGNPTAGPGFQEFKFLARLTASASPCAYSVDLYEDGSLVGNLATGTITSTTGQLITAVWDAADLGTADGSLVEAQITTTANVDTTGEIGAIEWNVTYTPSGATDSIREQILQSLETQMGVMLTANGYDFNVLTVERARRQFFDESDLPAIGIFDGDETLTPDFNDTRADMQVRVELHADASTTNRSTVLNKMKANLEKCIMSQDTTHSSLAGGSRITGMEMRLPDDDDSTLLTVAAIVTIQYTTVTGNPYSQPS